LPTACRRRWRASPATARRALPRWVALDGKAGGGSIATLRRIVGIMHSGPSGWSTASPPVGLVERRLVPTRGPSPLVTPQWQTPAPWARTAGRNGDGNVRRPAWAPPRPTLTAYIAVNVRRPWCSGRG
jgi:hypothetical protein